MKRRPHPGCRYAFSAVLWLFCFFSVSAQALLDPIVLWPVGAPQAKGTTSADIPVLIPFLPPRVRTATGVLVIPGGGYSGLSLPTEGYEIAHFLNAVPAELHIYEHGQDGFGLAAWDPVDSTWTSHMLDWLRLNDFLPELVKH